MSEKPITIVCVGMAGSGKTTLMQRLNSHLHAQRSPPYVLNLDPAVLHVPFQPNIDIRDSVDYKEVMRQYNLGPNGGIITSLNLFATKIDQIMGLLEKRAEPQPETGRPAMQHVLVDTPGQIEVFVWSASGAILLDALASSFPTVLAYVIDTPRSSATGTFMSNMLYACSILYKTKLPMILVCNKTDVQDADFIKEWMTDFEAFQDALKKEEETGSFGGFEGGGSGYMSSLLNSMSLVLEEFYRHLSVVGVSAMTGQGMDEFFKAAKEKAEEYERDYKPELEKRRELREKQKTESRDKELGKLMRDMNVDSGKKAEPQTLSDLEDDDDDDEGEGSDAEDIKDDGTGLDDRYKDALGDDKAADASFARYLKNAQI